MTVSDSCEAFRPTGSHLMVPGDHHPHWLSVSESELHFLNRSYILFRIYHPCTEKSRQEKGEGWVPKWNMKPLCKGIFRRQWPICFWCHKKRPRFFSPLPNMSAVSLSFYVSAYLIIGSSGLIPTNLQPIWNFLKKNRIAWYFLDHFNCCINIISSFWIWSWYFRIFQWFCSSGKKCNLTEKLNEENIPWSKTRNKYQN